VRYKTLTLAREFGSGGVEIAAATANELGWQLVDKALIHEISRMDRITRAL